jgi:hypothetical protein
VIAEEYPRLSACFPPGQPVIRGRIYFREAGSADWFYVEMTGDPPCFQAVLPRPRKDLRAIEYYVSGMDQQLFEMQSGVYTTPVTTTDACPAGSPAPVAEPDSVIIGSPSGSLPTGFLTGGGVSPGVILAIAGGGTALAALALTADDDGKEAPPPSARIGTVKSGSGVSELAVPGGRGWIGIDGGQGFGVGPGPTLLPLPMAPGIHRVEAQLAEARGPGVWRFDLGPIPLVPGSLRALEGEATEVGSARITFSMSGEPGRRASFTFRVKGH